MNDVKIVRKLDGGRGYYYINPNTYQVKQDKAYLINLNGNKCYNYEAAVMFSEFIEDLIGLKTEDGLVGSAKDVEVLTVEYDDSFEKGGCRLSEKQRRQIAGSVLLQFVVDNDGKRCSLEDAIKNVGKITFVSYCRGVTEVDEVLASFKTMLADESVGFSPDESNQIVDNIINIAYAPEKKYKQGSAIRFHSFSDRMFGEQYEYWYGEKNDSIQVVKYDKEDVEENELELYEDCFSNSVLVFASKLLNNSKHGHNDHHISIIEKDHNWRTLGAKFYDKFAGSQRVPAPQACAFSDMFAYSIAKSVAAGVEIAHGKSQLRPSLDEFKEDLDAIVEDYKKEYGEGFTCSNSEDGGETGGFDLEQL